MNTTKFIYVLIPEDNNKPLQELTCEYNEETIVPCLTNACKKHYNKIKTINKEKYRDQVISQIKSKDPNVVIPEETLNMLSQVQLVSIDPLLYNEKNNNYYGVSLYTDDSASAKNSQVNMRATSIARACGKNITVIGDAFISASRDDQKDFFVRCDFKIEDVSSNNAKNNWVERAKMQTLNLLKQQQAAANNNNKNTTTARSSNKKKNVTKKVADEYKQKLLKWKDGKLIEFDSNEEIRLQKIEKYGSKDGYEQFLQKKLEKKFNDTV